MEVGRKRNCRLWKWVGFLTVNRERRQIDEISLSKAFDFCGLDCNTVRSASFISGILGLHIGGTD